MMDKVDKAFQVINRADFLPDEAKASAGIDRPISIGFGQTNSQPSTVQLMLRWLNPLPGDKILDVGSGSGWTTALLSFLVSSKGSIYAVEKVPELVRFGKQNCRQLGIHNVRFFKADTHLGLAKFAPYDRILVSAAANKIPQELLAQLHEGGRLVMPVHNSVYVIDKTGTQTYAVTKHSGFAFVPLV